MNPDTKRPPATPAPYEDLHEVARNIHEKERAADASLNENLAKSLRIVEGAFAKLRARLAEEADPSVTSPSKKTKTDDDIAGSDVAERRKQNFGNDPNSVPVAIIAPVRERERIDFTTLKWSELKTYCKEVTGAAGRTKEECMRKLNDHFNQLTLAMTNTSVGLSTSEVSGQGSSTQPVPDVSPILDEDDLSQMEQIVRKQQELEARRQKLAAKIQAEKKLAEEQAAKAKQREFEERERQRLLEEERLAEEQRLIEQAKKEEEERQARLREKELKEQAERRRLERIAEDERKAREAEAEAERQRKAREAEAALKAEEERNAKQAEAARQRKAKEVEEARKAKELEDERRAEEARKAKELEDERKADEKRKAKELEDKAKEQEEEASPQAAGKPEEPHDAKSLSKQLAIEAQQKLNNGSQLKKRLNDLAPSSSGSQTTGKPQPKFLQQYSGATPGGGGSGGNIVQPSPARPPPVGNSPSTIGQTVFSNTPLEFRHPGVKPAHQPVAPVPAVVVPAPQPGPSVVHEEEMENQAELSPNKIFSTTLASNNKFNTDMDSLLPSDSDEEDGQEWTRSHNLKAALREQFEGRKDPDTIFPNMALMEFPMEAIFKKKRDPRRSSGATWMQNGPSDEPYRVFRQGGGGHHPPY